MGIEVDVRVPWQIAEWLALQQYPPTNIETIAEPCVAAWRNYRTEMYFRFFDSSEEELGRQAFLQHLMRRHGTKGWTAVG